MPNFLLINKMKNLNEEKNTYNNEILFCRQCLSIPHYSIEVESNGNIFLCHLCDKKKIKRKIMLCGKDNDENNNNYKCYICASKSEFICVGCNLIICEKCFKKHDNIIIQEEEVSNAKSNDIEEENEIDDESEEEQENKIIPILELQFLCKKHKKYYSHYCQLCKKNLCENCLMFHEHINNFVLNDIKSDKEIESFIETKGDTIPNEQLIRVSVLLAQCFKTCKANQTININIILNYLLIKEIVKFIQDKRERGVISNKFISDNNKSYFSKYFYDKNFVLYYEKLILDIQSGNVNSFHCLENIKKLYVNNKSVYLSYYNSLRNSYYLKLSILETDMKTDVLLVKDMIQTEKFIYSLIELVKLYEELNLENNMLEYNFELLKSLSFEIIYKLDFQLRRKTSNLITKELFNHFYENIQTLNTTQARISKSSSELKIKLLSLDKKKNEITKTNNYQNEIKLKLKNSLELMKCQVDKEIQNLQSNRITEEKNDIVFINLNEGEEEYLKAILFNLFMIIRNELHNKFNNSIHNEIQNINNILKEGKETQNKKIIQNGNSDPEVNKINVINVCKDKGMNPGKDKNSLTNIICKKKLEIIEFIEKFTINEQKFCSLNIEELFSVRKEKQIFSQYSENNFVNYLEESARLYNIPFESNIKNSINLFLKGDKSNLLCSKNIYLNSNTLKNDLEKIKKSLQKNEKLEHFVSEIIKTIKSNMNIIYKLMLEAFECLEEYKDIYDIKTLLRNLNIKIPFNPMKIILSKKTKSEPEQRYILKIMCEYSIFKNYYEEIKEIKTKIEGLNISQLDKEINVKIKIIDYFKFRIDENSKRKDSFFEEIWNSLKKRNIFIEETNEQMTKINQRIKTYVENHSCEDFINDFDKCVNSLIN